jgi:radical SAM protein with 4Fe4S-binding SPASM domain
MNVQWKDKINLLSKVSFRKAANLFLLLFSYHVSRVTKKVWHSGLPISMSIEPTTSCNLRCPECPSGLRSFSRPTGMLDDNHFYHIIDQVHSHLLYLVFYFQGEPYLNPKFLEMVAYASARSIYTSTSTNAHYLSDKNAEQTVRSGLDRLIISIDGTTQETYETYRIGGTLSKVLEGTRNVVGWKKKLKSNTPHVVFQFLVVRPNQHQIMEVKSLAEELGVDEVVFKTAQIYDYKNGSELMPDIMQFSRYKKNTDGSYSIKNDFTNSCWRMWQSCVVTWDGKIVPCCFDKDASHVLGNIREVRLSDIWRGKEYGSFRKSLMKSRSEIEICKNCTEGTKVTEGFGVNA